MCDFLPVYYLDSISAYLFFQTFAHKSAGLWAGRCCPLVRVVVGFIADVTSSRVMWERNAGLNQMIKLSQRADRFGKREIAVAAAGGGQAFRKLPGAAGTIGAGAHLVIRLFLGGALPPCANAH